MNGKHTAKCMELILLKFLVFVAFAGGGVHEKFALVKMKVVTRLFQAVLLLASAC